MSDEDIWPWSVLGFARMPADTAEIRRAYAKALKQIDQAKDIDGFETLRSAYETAMAQREGRTRRNASRRKSGGPSTALKPQEEVQTGERNGPPERQPAAVFRHEQSEAEILNASARHLISYLDKENLLEPAGIRIQHVLDDPAAIAPETAEMIRDQIVGLIRSKCRFGPNADLLSPEITPESILAMDRAYGWLNDYSAFRRDFYGNRHILDLLAIRAFGAIKANAPDVAERVPKGWRKVGYLIRKHPHVPFLCWFFLVRGLFDTGYTRQAEIRFRVVLVLVASPFIVFAIYGIFRFSKRFGKGNSVLIPGVGAAIWFSFGALIYIRFPELFQSDGASPTPLFLYLGMPVVLLSALILFVLFQRRHNLVRRFSRLMRKPRA